MTTTTTNTNGEYSAEWWRNRCELAWQQGDEQALTSFTNYKRIKELENEVREARAIALKFLATLQQFPADVCDVVDLSKVPDNHWLWD